MINLPPQLPPESIRRFMPSTDERFVRDGDFLLDPLLGHFPMTGLVVDVGCGYGRLAYALDRANYGGRYVGLDILSAPITWLQENFTPVRPKFEFRHFDVLNDRYNPNGKLSTADLSLPEGADLVILFSVFTHFYEEDLKTYLRLIAGSLKPGGLICATFFLLNSEQRALEAEGKSQYPMRHVFNGHTAFFNDADPLHAIGYEEHALLGWVADAGLRLEKTMYGGWCGRRNAPVFQDTMLIRR